MKSFSTIAQLFKDDHIDFADVLMLFKKELEKPTPKELSEVLVKRGFRMNDFTPTSEELIEMTCFMEKHDIQGWEGWFLPENNLYPKVLAQINTNDVVFDVGAGNLALDVLLADKAKKVYAVEVNPLVVIDALEEIGLDLPRNLIVICGNAFDVPIPKDVNTIVLLMRHFVHDIPEEWLDIPKIILNIYGEVQVNL